MTTCPLIGNCKLPCTFRQAARACVAVLDGWAIAEIAASREGDGQDHFAAGHERLGR